MKMQIREFAALSGVSVRTLHYYDEIGLLKPAFVDSATGYRFYDASSALRMQEILFYRELDFSLNRIRAILSSPDHNKEQALQDQRKLLELKKEQLERLILAIDDALKGEINMNAFDQKELEQYKKEAKARWGATEAYRQYEQKAGAEAAEAQADHAGEMDQIMAEFAACRQSGAAADSGEAQSLVKKLQAYITAHYYNCTQEILASLGEMYVADERFRNNIDRHGAGTAAFIRDAVKCKALSG